MKRMSDIYWCIGCKLEHDNFYTKNIDEKKEVIDSELKDYIINKAQRYNICDFSNVDKNDLSVIDLVNIVGEKIPTHEHFDTIRHLTHFVIEIAGSIQGKAILWYVEEEPDFIDNQIALLDENGHIESFTTHKDSSFVNDFEFVYEVFMNSFMKEPKILKK